MLVLFKKKRIKLFVLIIFSLLSISSGYVHLLEDDNCHFELRTNQNDDDHCTLCLIAHNSFIDFPQVKEVQSQFVSILFLEEQKSVHLSSLFNIYFERGPPKIS